MRLTMASARSNLSVEASQREDSGRMVRMTMPQAHRIVAMKYIHLQPMPSKCGPARAKESPRGKEADGVVNKSPSQMPRKAPSDELMKTNEVKRARPAVGAISPI